MKNKIDLVPGDKIYDITRGKGIVREIVDGIIKIEFLNIDYSTGYFGYYTKYGVNYAINGSAYPVNRSLFKYKKYIKILKIINKYEWNRLNKLNRLGKSRSHYG